MKEKKLLDDSFVGFGYDYEFLAKKLLSIIPKSEIERLDGTLGEFCDEFVGFIGAYYYLSELLPKEYTIIDFGAGYNAHSYFFKDFKRYIAIRPDDGCNGCSLDDNGMFCPPNCEIYRMTTKEFLENVEYPKRRVFAICNFVPNWYGEDSIDLVHKHFRNCYTFYPND